MIPLAYLAEWRATTAPWQQLAMVEQDLVISRALLNIFADDYLRGHLAFRGGTALYKLYLTPPARYSEDIDLVQLKSEPIRDTIVHFQAVLDPWLGSPNYTSSPQSVKLLYRFPAEATPGLRQRLKIEINTREHIPAFSLESKPFSVTSRWFSGATHISTFSLEELLATKLRALYQRKKGRDLFDLDYALRTENIDTHQVIIAFVHYLRQQGLRISARQFQLNMQEKLKDPKFGMDILPLLRSGIEFDTDDAITRVEDRLISQIDAAW